jgi:hypothetical protein
MRKIDLSTRKKLSETPETLLVYQKRPFSEQCLKKLAPRGRLPKQLILGNFHPK